MLHAHKLRMHEVHVRMNAARLRRAARSTTRGAPTTWSRSCWRSSSASSAAAPRRSASSAATRSCTGPPPDTEELKALTTSEADRRHLWPRRCLSRRRRRRQPRSRSSAGPPTLGEAILLANPGDTIVVPAGEYLLTEGDALEAKDLTLRGAGEGETTVIPSGGGEAFDDPGVTVEGVTIGRPAPARCAAPRIGRRGRRRDLDPGSDHRPRGTLAIFLFMLDLVRRRRLVERYALLWMIAALALLVLAIWTDGLDVITDADGDRRSRPTRSSSSRSRVAFLLLLNFSVARRGSARRRRSSPRRSARLEQELASAPTRGASRTDRRPRRADAGRPPVARRARPEPRERPAAPR